MQHRRRRPDLTRYHVFFWSLAACSNFEPGAILGQLDGGAGIGVAGFSFNGAAQSGQGGRAESSTPNGAGLKPSVTKDPDDQGSDSTSAGGADGGNAGDESSGATSGAGGSGGDVAGSGVGGVPPDGSGASGGVSGASAGAGTAASVGGRAGSAGLGPNGGRGGASGGRGGSGSSGGRGGTTASGGHSGSGAGPSSSGGSGAASGAAGHGSSGAAGSGPPPPRDLILSEYVEGSASFKAIEIRSETATHLDGCQLATYFNGKPTATRLALDGTVAAGDVYVLCTEELAASLGSVCDRTTNLSFNGNDAIALECEGAALDVLGQIGFDPDDAWSSADASTLNRTLRRRCASPTDPDGSDAFDPAIAWLALPTDTFDGLGDPACE